MLKNLTQKQKILIISSYCILVLILAITLLQSRKNNGLELRQQSEIEDYINISEKSDNLVKENLKGNIEFNDADSLVIPQVMGIYQTNPFDFTDLEKTLMLTPKVQNINYEELENDDWIFVKEKDVKKYTLGSKKYKAEQGADMNLESSANEIAKSFLLQTFALDVDNLQLTCKTESKTTYFQFTCHRKLDDYEVFKDLSLSIPISVDINSELQVYFVQVSNLDILNVDKIDSVNILSKKELSSLSIKQINELGRITILALEISPTSQEELHSHPTEIVGNITYTKITNLNLVYQIKETETGTLLVPVFVMTGDVVTNQSEDVSATIIYPATNPIQTIED